MKTMKDVLALVFAIGSLLIIPFGLAVLNQPAGSLYITQYEE